MRILIGPIAVAEGQYMVSPGCENPGIGGTEHMAFQLALRLSEVEDFEVTLGMSGLHRTVISSRGTLAAVDLTGPNKIGEFDACVVPVWQAEWFLERIPKVKFGRLIVWSHHPHDRTLARLCAKHVPDAVVSVGGYQYYSNRTHGIEHHWVPNPFPRWAERQDPPSVLERLPIVGHVGALVRAKGFHRIARHWSEVVEQNPNLKLEVIGSGALYGPLPDSDPQMPMDFNYGQEVRKRFGQLGVPTSVDFLGLVQSKLSYMSSWRYGLQNLTGGSEAMPASVQELIVHGVPVVASGNFGMWDFMSDFPELTLSHPREFPAVLARLEGNPSFADQMVERCAEVAEKWHKWDTNCLVPVWEEILRGEGTRAPHRPQSPPLPRVNRRLRNRVRVNQLIVWMRFGAHSVIDRYARLPKRTRGV